MTESQWITPETLDELAARVAPRTMGELFQRAGIPRPESLEGDRPVLSLEDDSRRVKSDTVFVAVEGALADGHEYIEQAIDAGCSLVVAEKYPGQPDAPDSRPRMVENKILLVKDSRVMLGLLSQAYWGNPSKHLQVVGVTGTNGKTTTVYLLEGILRNRRRYPTLLSTVEVRVGGARRDATNTTPGALETARLMALSLDRDADSVVMEVSSHAIDQRRVEGVNFEVAVLTNVTQDHLDYHGTMEAYAAVKQKLFTHHHPRTAVFNLDDPISASFSEAYEERQLTFSLDPKSSASVCAERLELTDEGIRMRVAFRIPSSELRHYDVVSPLRGRFNASNILAALAAAVAMGMSPESAVAALRGLRGAPGRFESVEEGQDFSVIIDYGHTPDAVENVLENVRPLTRGKLIAVLGCGGDRDAAKRPLMGRAMGRLADYAIVTNDNPRSEDPASIAEAVRLGVAEVKSDDAYELVIDRRAAIRHAIEIARPGDAVVICGKGHETYQIIGDKRWHFSDHEVAAEILRDIMRNNK
jgi:UDP-N-acetylmuramoyl-L-alanyl-D-glutamate--2,6-diaminopimelate ligase